MDDTGAHKDAGVHTGNDEFNQMLMSMTTASVGGTEASEQWVARKKGRGDKRLRGSEKVGVDAQKRSRSEDHGCNEVLAGPERVVESVGEALDTSGQHSKAKGQCTHELMVHRLMEYVMTREVGGRRSAAQCDSGKRIPPRSALLAEAAIMRPAAQHHVHHVIHGATSVSHGEKALDDITLYRRKLYCCSYDRDIVGGYFSDKPLHTFEHLRTLVQRGLRNQMGEDVGERRTTSVTSDGSVEGSPRADGAVVLFDGVEGKTLGSFLKDSSSEEDSDR
uniref:Uncharacterized protein TCIL3000_11_8830 n=1 Tax=Trypanosoma congolense (strain IL3000) TaxID=1068625 RepID=G0V1A5_TRYCI|nr:unnamed protein product [Trypanosoma congolense IL3000]